MKTTSTQADSLERGASRKNSEHKKPEPIKAGVYKEIFKTFLEDFQEKRLLGM